MLHITYDSLLAYLQKKHFEVIPQNVPQQIASQLTAGKEKYPLFVKIDSENSIVQLVVFFPYTLPQKGISDVARLLHFYNRDIDIPGFGMDEVQGALFYRYSLIGEGGVLSENILNKLMDALPKLCEGFFPTIALAIAGKVTFDAILERSKKKNKK